jgi:hypothetical protein
MLPVALTTPETYTPVLENTATLLVPSTLIVTLAFELAIFTLLVPLLINVVSTPNSPTYL